MDFWMSFSLSTFVVEIGKTPTIVFQAKWQADADLICREWIQSHWDELSKKGRGGVDLPPAFRLRLARPSERAAYEADNTAEGFFGDVKIVRLTKRVQQDEPAPQDVAADAHGETAPALQDRQTDDGGEAQ